jgi:hypothetical protein
MKINVVKDESGKVVATYEHAVRGGPTVRPVLKPGHKVHEIEASEDYRNNIKAFYAQHSR